MKKIIAVFICVFMILGITGCKENTKSVNINVTFEGTINSVEVKVGKKLTYTLLGTEYEFKITDITEKEIRIEVNHYGLTDTNNLLSKDKKFVIEKGKKLEVHTQSTDYQESITFEY